MAEHKACDRSLKRFLHCHVRPYDTSRDLNREIQDAHGKRVNTFQSLEFLEQYILVHLQSMYRMKQEKITC